MRVSYGSEARGNLSLGERMVTPSSKGQFQRDPITSCDG